MHHSIFNIAIRVEGNADAQVDTWFLPGFGKSQLCFGEAFNHPIARAVRLITFDLPGLGSSPAPLEGLAVKDCAELWCNLISNVSSSRRGVLVAHSMAGIIATETAKLLDPLPALVVSVEGNLTLADAYYSGQAARYETCEAFYAAFVQSIAELASKGEVPDGYLPCLKLADPYALWTLGRSIVSYTQPGREYASLSCSTIHYWDFASTSPDSREFLLHNNLVQRRFDGLGHWPMLTSPTSFYLALQADIAAVA
jgi:pimeloyl-ACP methyl ester carboxylesterase